MAADLREVDGVVLDIDGVLVDDWEAIDGAAEAVATALEAAAGLRGVLVRTGGFRDQDLADVDDDPDVVIDSIADLPDLLGWLTVFSRWPPGPAAAPAPSTPTR